MNNFIRTRQETGSDGESVMIPKEKFEKDGVLYELRFFDCDSSHDLVSLVQIIEDKEVQKWMEEVDDLSLPDYRRWMDRKGENNAFLFAIASVDSEQKILGFVNIYPASSMGGYEVSYAKKPNSPSGLIAPALKIACRWVLKYLKIKKNYYENSVKFRAEIEKSNVASEKVVERAGFTKISELVKPDGEHDSLWELTVTNPEGMIRAKQETGTYCGLAVLQMLLSSYGVNVSQDNLLDACGARATVARDGIPPHLLAKGVTVIAPDLVMWAKRRSSLQDLKDLLDLGYKVGIDWQGIFHVDEYEAEEESPKRNWFDWWKRSDENEPELKGDQGHYCVALEVDIDRGYLKFADPYGSFAGKDRFVALWEFEERWWDDRIGVDESGKKIYVLEERLMFVIAKKDDLGPEKVGMISVSQ